MKGALVLWTLLAARLHSVHTACTVSMYGGLPDPQPLILTTDGRRDAYGFKLPTADGVLVFARGEEVRLVCPGPSNSFVNLPRSLRDIRVRCDNATAFLHDGATRSFESFGCAHLPRSATRRTSTRCGSKNNSKKARVLVEIGFEATSTEFFKLIDVCFDTKNISSVWSKMDVVSVIHGGEDSFDSGAETLTADTFYTGLDPDDLYTVPTQRFTIGRIIGHIQAGDYINSTHYLMRGLLSDSRNFVYKSQMLAALRYINSAPQWYSIRMGPWGVVEKRIRRYAHERGVNLVVYTGTHGVTTLPDSDKIPSERKLYLHVDVENHTRQVAVPALFWKVVYEPVSKKAVALVSMNNPYKDRRLVEAESGDAMYNVCAGRKLSSSWYICGAVGLTAGFGYCCDVDDFRRAVTTLPPFEVTDVLT